jgi:hypothetical protein
MAMWRGIAVAVALVVPAVAPTASGSAVCSTHLTWHAAAYRAVATPRSPAVGRRLGNGTLHTCSTTNVPPGYAAGAARVGTDALVRPVYAVPGVRSQVAVALKSRTRATLYVSRATPTAAERAVLTRLRNR